MAEPAQKKEIALFPNQFLFSQDLMSGRIDAVVGPTKFNPSGQEKSVLYEATDGTFKQIDDPEKAVQKWPFAPEGYYLQLLNPAVRVGDSNKEEIFFPQSGKVTNSPNLHVGRKINIQGPTTFPLWPGQKATLIRGHQPRSNQYLLVRIYNAEEARKHWDESRIRTQPSVVVTDKTEEKTSVGEEIAKGATTITTTPPAILNDGDLFIIKGEETSFYMPPTGISVVPEVLENGMELYVREALTLERMEYCILVDEDGNKRYERGPQVVFPQPTEKFISVKNRDNEEVRKFPAIELTRVQAIHVMVTAEYFEGTKQFKAGEEIFIKGSDGNQIYFPRAEHRLVTYDGAQKHFATAIPAGEARYVMERLTAKIYMVRGYSMCLPDPRTEVFVRRALSDRQAKEWYPGNQEVEAYNRELRDLATKAPTTRAGAVSEGEFARSGGEFTAGSIDTMKALRGKVASTRQLVSNESFMEKSVSNSLHQAQTGADKSERSSTYTKPRTLTLNTKLDGVPLISPFSNFAVCVVSKGANKRRIEIGPTNVLMEWDDDLEILTLSTSKPKTTDNLLRTPYLQIKSNKVSDVVQAETKDHVGVQLKFSLNVDFEEASKEKWFGVPNYVKLLCDHVRSILKSQIRKLTIEQFYVESTDLIRDFLLGKATEGGKRPNNLFFQENGMRVMDVDVLGMDILEPVISKLLAESAIQTVKQQVEVDMDDLRLQSLRAREEIARQTAEEQAKTAIAKNMLEIEKQKSGQEVELAKLDSEKIVQTNKAEVVKLQQNVENLSSEQILSRQDKSEIKKLEWTQKSQSQKLEFIKAETEAAIAKVAAMSGGFNEVVAALHDSATLEKVAQFFNVQTILGGKTLADTVKQALGEPLSTILTAAMDRSGIKEANGKLPPAQQVRT